MTSQPEPGLREWITATHSVLHGARSRLYALADHDLTDLTTALLELQAAAQGLAAAVTIEAHSRGVIAASTATGIAGWIRARASDAGVSMSGPEANAWQQVTTKAQAPDMGVFADAVTTGRIGVTGGAVLAKELRRIRDNVPAATWDACAADVVDYAADGGLLDPTQAQSASGGSAATDANEAGQVCPWCGATGGRLARSPIARPGGLARAQVVLTMGFEALRDQCGYGLTTFGQPLSPQTVRAFACEANVIPMILGSEGEILDQGRAARTATPGQWVYLRQRDKGCTFPGCDRPPGFCQAHHVRHWVRHHGTSDVSNMTLLCTRHHLIVHRDHYTADVTATGVRWRRDHPPPNHSSRSVVL